MLHRDTKTALCHTTVHYALPFIIYLTLSRVTLPLALLNPHWTKWDMIV